MTKSSSVAVILTGLLLASGFSSAHNAFTHFHVNGKADSSCVRQVVSTDPITDLASDAMACNVVKGNAKTKCTVQAGEEVAFEWRTDPGIPAAEYPLQDGEPVGVTDTSHMGPCAVYAKKVSDALTAEGPGDGWFKISEDGLDSNGVFCTTRLREANAAQPAKIPTTIEPGDYLLRPEFLTLNNAGAASIGGQEEPQFYTGCVQVTIEGTSGTAKPATVSIPGYVTEQSPGLIFDVWNAPNGRFSAYPIPGPEPFVDGTSSPAAPSSSAAAAKPPVSTVKSPSTVDTVPTLAPEPTIAEPQVPAPSEVADVPSEEDEFPGAGDEEQGQEEEEEPSEVPPISTPVPLPSGFPAVPTTFIQITKTASGPTITQTSTVGGPSPTTSPAASGVPTPGSGTTCRRWCRFFKLLRKYQQQQQQDAQNDADEADDEETEEWHSDDDAETEEWNQDEEEAHWHKL